MRIAALILAGGASRRAGGANKLLARDRDGQCMIVRSVRSALRSQAASVTVVLGHDPDRLAAVLDDGGLRPDGARLRLTRAGDHAEGLSASLRRGVSLAAEQGAQGLLVCLGDMPLVRPQTHDRLMAALRASADTLACVPVMEGHRGNPVLWRDSLFGDLLALRGDRGGRLLLDRHARHVRDVAVDDPGVLEDFDTPERLAYYATLQGEPRPPADRPLVHPRRPVP